MFIVCHKSLLQLATRVNIQKKFQWSTVDCQIRRTALFHKQMYSFVIKHFSYLFFADQTSQHFTVIEEHTSCRFYLLSNLKATQEKKKWLKVTIWHTIVHFQVETKKKSPFQTNKNENICTCAMFRFYLFLMHFVRMYCMIERFHTREGK